MKKSIFVCLAGLTVLLALKSNVSARGKIQVLKTYPFDATAFTQGLEYAGNQEVLLGTGRKGESRIEYFNVSSGKSRQRQDLSHHYFGEGVTQSKDFIYQLTWKSGVAFRRKKNSLEEIDRLTYDGEGWGLAYNPEQGHIYMSDGSNRIQVRDEDFHLISDFYVTHKGQPMNRINELEYANGYLYANIWQSNLIIKMDPKSGQVVDFYDFAQVLRDNFTSKERDQMDVLNGIAHIEGNTFYITGKFYPKILKVRLD